MTLLIHFFALALILIPATAFGQTDNSFAPLTSIPGLETAGEAPNITSFLNQLYKICIGVAAAIAVLQIIRAGILFMTNKGSVSENEQARSLLQGAVFGLILVLSPVIVFGIINPKILELNFSADLLETAPAPSGGTGNSDPSQNPICTNDTHDQYQYATVPQGGQCNDVLGGGWVTLGDATAVCCSGTRGEGQVCCGHGKYYTPPTPPPSGAEFNISTQKLDLNLASEESGDQCRLTSYQSFDTLQQCEAQEARVLAGTYSGTVLTKRCNGSSVTPPEPSATWAQMSDKPVCPRE
ncbi:MAG TPA: pilin [Candidatus Paceibacterota bacterium]|nr:pilin [Candidatus Paceibacterota bacterium]